MRVGGEGVEGGEWRVELAGGEGGEGWPVLKVTIGKEKEGWRNTQSAGACFDGYADAGIT